MDLRRFFIGMRWWGKLTGAFLGYLISGPVGALIGILVGNFFDHKLGEHFSRPHWYYHAEKRKKIQKIFFEATFSILGLVAKADGRVSENEIAMAKTLMKEFGLNHSQKKMAIAYFNAGKNPSFNLHQMMVKLKEVLIDNPDLIKLFIDIQYRAAKVDGFSGDKQNVLNTILAIMDLASLHHQYRFYEDFSGSSNQKSEQKQKSSKQRLSTLDHAYAILNVSPASSKSELKRAYRQLMSKNHPDKLISQGLPEQMIKIANEKTQAISKAYDLICKSKGW